MIAGSTVSLAKPRPACSANRWERRSRLARSATGSGSVCTTVKGSVTFGNRGFLGSLTVRVRGGAGLPNPRSASASRCDGIESELAPGWPDRGFGGPTTPTV